MGERESKKIAPWEREHFQKGGQLGGMMETSQAEQELNLPVAFSDTSRSQVASED